MKDFGARVEIPLPISETWKICEMAWKAFDYDADMRTMAQNLIDLQDKYHFCRLVISLQSISRSVTELEIYGIDDSVFQEYDIAGQIDNLLAYVEEAAVQIVGARQQERKQQEQLFLSELESLAKLHHEGILSNEEFQDAKAQLLKNS